MKKQDMITKSIPQIFKDNICTLFNLLNFLIAVALACVGAWSNMFFICIIILNITIGIFQEIKAKKLVEELSLLSIPYADVLRDGKEMHISINEVETGDILLLSSGNQICADCIVISGEMEVNESLLTGESDPIVKKSGDSLLSGSAVISGKCEAKAIHTGNDNYASQIANEVKKMKKQSSELVSSMRKVTKLTGFFIVPLGIMLFLEAFLLRHDSIFDSVVNTSAGLLGMLPKGLFLLISIGLASGIIRLSQKKVLVQDLYSLESLAHVDVLCLDKTGTLTEGRMMIEKVISLDNDIPFGKLIGSFLKITDDNNATFMALRDYFSPNDEYKFISKIPFSSDRKWSSATFENGTTLVIGAPEKLSSGYVDDSISSEISNGKRVLLAGIVNGDVTKDSKFDNIKIIAGIVIIDPVRKNAKDTIAYFIEQGVDIKIISGDNPLTVSSVATTAGVPNASKYIDMSVVNDNDLSGIVNEYSVFGRVTPQQKRMLVNALQEQGHKVAMTGDGVNDLLAMKESDCSIAVGSGSDAARQSAKLVLLESDFGVLRDVLAEGRRVVNNVTKSAGVFFIKTLYSIALCLFCIIFNKEFTFLPIQITLIDLAIEGYPAFFLSFEPNDRKVKGKFLYTAIMKALPNAISIVLFYIVITSISATLGLNDGQLNFVLYTVIGAMGIDAVVKSCYPFNKLRLFLAATTSVGFYTAMILFHTILHLPFPDMNLIVISVIMVAASVLIERIITLVSRKLIKKKIKNLSS